MAEEIITTSEQSEQLSEETRETLRKMEAEARARYRLPAERPQSQEAPMPKQSKQVRTEKALTRSVQSVADFVCDVPTELILGDPEKLEKGFTARATVLASMPHSKTKDTTFVRRNGNYALKMQADPEVGLPYGTIPRLLLAWITTEAVRTKSRTLTLGKNLAEFLEKLDIPRTGSRIRALKDQMNRLFSTSISCVYSDKERTARLNMYPVEQFELWWTTKDPEQVGLNESSITLSERFFREITERSVVFYMDALKVLKKSPMALDIYMWLTYRNSYAKESSLISWESLQAQFGAGYPTTAEGKRKFKYNFKAALKKVTAVYPEARKLYPTEKGLLFIPGMPHVSKTKELPEKP